MKTIEIAYGEHPSQFGVLRRPEAPGNCPVMVSIHGGFWQSKYGLEENEPLAEDLAKRGFATWNIEYRRIGEEGGVWPGTFHDVVSAVNHLDQLKDTHQLDLSKVVVIGHSAGGHLALLLGSFLNVMDSPLVVPIKGIISLAGVTDLGQMLQIHTEREITSPVTAFLGGSMEELPIASPIELLPLNVEQVLIHGELDRHVPVSLSVDYHRRAEELGDSVRLITLPEADHFMVVDPTSSAWKTVTDSLEGLI
ncbi:alpha/beta hydrolase [Neobacillus niacini]|uniref:alpha/beta hydrolase n=1 Tax=Neobacillus niacini TaxID=86668 RepID=UPI0007ABE7EE|nr:alpha/beta hydrolase [Neobacillus niacini]MEC1520720.1 alpha/beta hydrolase [Neobacillus niacini]